MTPGACADVTGCMNSARGKEYETVITRERSYSQVCIFGMTGSQCMTANPTIYFMYYVVIIASARLIRDDWEREVSHKLHLQ